MRDDRDFFGDDEQFKKDAADLAEGLGDAATTLGKGFARSRLGKWVIGIWLLGVVAGVTVIGIVLWALVQLVKHFTAG